MMGGRSFSSLVLCALASASVWAQSSLSPQAQLWLRPHVTRAVPEAGQPVTAYVMQPDGSLATVHATPAVLTALAATGEVRYLHLTTAPQPMLDKARPEAGVERIREGEALERAYTGKGVVVGIVDAGFDYTHPAFRHPVDGSLRIARVWEQGTESFEGCHAPEGFGYGIEMTEAADILRAQADATINSHGTHVAAIAAGSDTYMEGAWQGTAPGADIVLVSLDQRVTTQADITNAVQYIFDYATEVGKPCVVNLSLGNHDGPHDGTSFFDRMADRMQGPGRLIVGAAGNHHKDAFHLCRTFQSAEDAPLRTFLSFKTTPSRDSHGGMVQLWAEKGMELEVELSAYSTFNKKDMVSVPVYPAEGIQTVKLGSYATGTLEVASEVNPLNGKLNMVIRSALTSVRNNYAVALTVRPKGAGTVDVWADNTWLALDDRDIEGFTRPTDASTIAEIGGTGKRILTVGAYVTRNDFQTSLGTGTLDETIGALGSFSSQGPTADGRVKPEVTAPGCYIVSALSAYDASGTKQVAFTARQDDQTWEYGYMQGTSMSAPFVTGVVATWLEANPQLTPEQLKDIVASTARRDAFTGELPAGGSPAWGFGKVDAYAGLLQCIEASPVRGVEAGDGLRLDLTLQGRLLQVTFLEAMPQATLTVYSPQGATCAQAHCGTMAAGTTRTLSLSHLPRGMYLLEVKTARDRKVVRFPVNH